MPIKRVFPIALVVGAAVALSACATFQRGPVGNAAVPQPTKAVDLNRYAGLGVASFDGVGVCHRRAAKEQDC